MVVYSHIFHMSSSLRIIGLGLLGIVALWVALEIVAIVIGVVSWIVSTLITIVVLAVVLYIGYLVVSSVLS